MHEGAIGAVAALDVAVLLMSVCGGSWTPTVKAVRQGRKHTVNDGPARS
jgi:hypothetical protein